MNSAQPPMRHTLLAILFALFLHGCNRDPGISQLSEKPDALHEAPSLITQARPGRFALRARIAHADLQAIASEQLPSRYPVRGSREVCKRIIGIKACGTANWDLMVTRRGEFALEGQGDKLGIQAPIAITGQVGMDGRVAKALGLSSVQVKGVVIPTITLGLEMQENWCPRIRASIAYHWVEKPVAIWQNRVDFDLRDVVDDALAKQMNQLEPRLNKAIDCSAFRKQLAGHWRSYSFALDIPAADGDDPPQQVHLNIVPTAFAFSGFRAEPDTLGVSFALDATTVVNSTPLPEETLNLPTLKQIEYEVGQTDFDLILRADYSQMEQVISPRLVGKTYHADSPAGDVSVTISALALSGSIEGATVTLEFLASLPGSRKETRGIVYLHTTPVVDTEKQQLRLDNVRLSKVLDSKLWNLIGTVFENQIITAIKRGAVVDLASRTDQLEKRLLEQLSDPARTGGVQVQVDDLTITLLALVPESTGLAAKARVSAQLDLLIPLTVIQRPLK